MTIKQAIEKAVEGGWKGTEASGYFLNVVDELVPGAWRTKSHQAMAFLDPLFWQSLGKAMGWKRKHRLCGGNMVCHQYPECCMEGWLREWHRFIDHLAEGKDAESFFESL